MQFSVFVHRLRFEMLDNGVEQRFQIRTFAGRIQTRRAVSSRTEHDGAHQLFVRRVEFQKKFQNFLFHFFATRVGTVDLIDHDDELMP